MIYYVFNDHGKLIGLAFRAPSPQAPAVQSVHVFNEYGKLVGYAFA